MLTCCYFSHLKENPLLPPCPFHTALPLTPKLPRPPDLRTGCSLRLEHPSSRGRQNHVVLSPHFFWVLNWILLSLGDIPWTPHLGCSPNPPSPKLTPLSWTFSMPPGRSVPLLKTVSQEPRTGPEYSRCLIICVTGQWVRVRPRVTHHPAFQITPPVSGLVWFWLWTY